MNFNDIIKQQRRINFLKEAFAGEFTVGFELEGVCTWNKNTEDENFYLPRYGSYSENNQPEGGARKLKEYLDKLFKLEGSISDSKIEQDTSLDTNDISDLDSYKDSWNFEYATNRIPFNTQNIKKIYDGLSILDEDGIFTNNSCGFHIHMSFPDMDKKEVAWIMCCIASDRDLLEELLKMDTENYGTIYLFNSKFNGNNDEIGGYARYHYLLDLGNALDNKDYSTVDELLSNEKYRVLHIHSENGTIEWRGPRGFLNYGDSDLIKSFILKWFKFVTKIAKMTQVTSYQGTNTHLVKNELLSHLSLKYFSLDTPIEKKRKDNKKRLFNSLIDVPVKLFSFSPKAIKNLYEYNSRELIKIIYSLVVNDMFGEDWALLKKDVFNMIFQLYSIYFLGRDLEIFNFASSLWYPLKSNGVSLLQKLDTTNKNMLAYICTNILLSDYNMDANSEEFDEICEDLDIINTEIFKKSISEKFKQNIVIPFEEIFNITTILPSYIWNILLNNKYVHYVSLIENVPEKYQLRMIKKDPFNIQYINNPSEKVIKMAEQMNSNVKDYIRGE